MSEFKNGDMFWWAYTEQQVFSVGILPYHCCSRICEYKDGKFVDTYWSTGGNRMFSESDIGTKITVTLLGNINDYREADPLERRYYADKDCMDLTHANSYNQFFVRKDAKRDLEKMKRIAKRYIYKHQKAIEWANNALKRMQDDLEHMKADSYLTVEQDVCLYDESYEDEEQS